MIEEIKDWLDGVFAQPIPEDVAAFCFNLYEDGDGDWSAEFVGTKSFDAEDGDWACDEVNDFGTRDEPFTWNSDEGWEGALKSVVSALKNYLENGAYSDILKSRSGVGVGFVDGDIEIIYKRGD